MTWEILWISTSFRHNDIRLYQAQLIATIIVWIWALIWAIYIWRKQINISQEQWKITEKQTKLIETQLELSTYIHNVNKAQYHVEILARNLDTNLLQTIAASIIKYNEKDENIRLKVEEWLQNVDIGIWKVNEKLDEAIDEYHKAIKNLPKSLILKS